MVKYYLIIAGLVIYQLYKDFSKDAGKHRTAKAIHFISLLLLMFMFLGSFRQLVWIASNIASLKDYYGQEVGFLPENAYLVIFATNTLLSFVALILVFRLTRRKDKARRSLLNILPVLALTNFITVYREAMLMDTIDLENYQRIIIGAGLAFIVAIYGGTILLYKSRMIKNFFLMKSDDTPDEFDTLDEEIATEISGEIYPDQQN